MKKLSTFNLIFILFCIGLMVFIFMLVPHETKMNTGNTDGYSNYSMERN
ncbi:MAG: hypothetical protein IPQ03_05325 [Bacteroidetes bacterium]|jgi:hypothetical protein|nr:hypothetical protein [Bacteroidota bacterium]MBP6401563.1 hypothetical protein [Bacteroidia bacterium]MBK9526547.1 hypothetical protein [Bacteroidota bacterium]MBK9542634.1 hypothetical protein [Bacteroidota bacterium]MBL0256968.1 hypothetical protein [Bacteroidota bacterium]